MTTRIFHPEPRQAYPKVILFMNDSRQPSACLGCHILIEACHAAHGFAVPDLQAYNRGLCSALGDDARVFRESLF